MAFNVLIGGGTGFVGQAITRSLKQNGHSVKIISRQSGKPDKISWSSIRENGLPHDTDAVVNVSGAPVINPFRRWTDEYKQEVRNSRLHTNKWLRQAIISSAIKPKVFATISGVGFYPSSKTATYDEESPGGVDEYLAILANGWENEAKLPSDCDAVRQVIVRSGVVLGKGGGLMANLTWPFWLGLGGQYGNGQQFFPWIHVDDIAAIFVHSIENEVSGILNAVSPDIRTNGDFTKEFAGVMRRPAFFTVPAFVIKCTLGDERSPMLLQGQKVIPKRTLESGYKFIHPNLTDALRNIV
uniref:epimerase family protein SDR39U1-like n=1 Tax=Styela clava TaxID=7725 RepID=UPI00193AC891|nr:epimerase family protein SDR39U1-like [Styela clava]